MPQSAHPAVRLREAGPHDLDVINAIYNQEVLHGVATWDVQPWSAERRAAWYAERGPGTPALVAVVDDGAGGAVVGFGYLSEYRPKPGYRFSLEDTLYVRPDWQRRGVGRMLLAALVERARGQGVHALLAWIEAENAASIELHRAFGFDLVGVQREVGAKFGRWLSLALMECRLD